MQPEARVHFPREYDYDTPAPKIEINERERLTLESILAVGFIEKWGMVAGEPDGEDSAGRAKLRLSTPEEVVARAFKMAELTVQTARDKGLVLITPSFVDMDEAAAQRKTEVEAKKKAKNATT